MKLNRPFVNSGLKSHYQINEYDPLAYQDFLRLKVLPRHSVNGNAIEFPTSMLSLLGYEIDATRDLPLSMPDNLFDYQIFAITLAFKRQKFALLQDCGFGKTIQFLEWIRQVLQIVPGKALIISPLMVIRQTIEESIKWYNSDYPHIHNLHSWDLHEWLKSDYRVGIVNFDKFKKEIDLTGVDAIVLDESGILKNEIGKIRTALIDSCRGIPFKLCASATPAPNDPVEYGNHAVFLDQARGINEFKSRFFINRANKGTGWELKGHAVEAFHRFLAGWSVFIHDPKKYGFDDCLKELPPIEVHEQRIPMLPEQLEAIKRNQDRLQMTFLADTPNGLKERGLYSQVSKGFVYHKENGKRVIEYVPSRKPGVIAEIVNSHPDAQILIWCVYDEEGELIKRKLADSGRRICHLTGKMQVKHRQPLIDDFRRGGIDVMISKPRLLGFGLNFQICTVMIFSGTSDSYEQFYQAIKRAHRFGQKETLHVYLPYTMYEEVQLRNVLEKRDEHERLSSVQEKLYIEQFIPELKTFLGTGVVQMEEEKEIQRDPVIIGDNGEIELYHCDSIAKMLDDFPRETVDFAVFSPPFSNDLYAYTNSAADVGNSGGVGATGRDEFMMHFAFFIKGLWQAMKQDRLVACHVMQPPLRKGIDGMMGLSDFRGDVIRAFQKGKFTYYGEITVLKNPQAQAIRTRSHALTMTNMEKNRARIRPALNDYLLIFKKPGDNSNLLNSNEVSRNEWIEFADGIWQERQYNTPSRTVQQKARFDEYIQTLSGFWHDIKETDTLNAKVAKEEADEKHICALQLSLINRAIRLWSDPGDVVLDPFMGIGSSGVEAVKLNRQFIGMELKGSYFDTSVRNIRDAWEHERAKVSLFDWAGVKV